MAGHEQAPELDEAHARLWDSDEQAQDIAEEAFDSLLEHVDLHDPSWKAKRVLDVGCGTGLLTEELAPLMGEVVAVDISPAMLGVLDAKDLGNVTTHCADIDDENLPWGRGFDLVVASCVFGALPNYAATVARLAAVLNPGGLFAQWDWLSDAPESDGLSLVEVATAFTSAGLSRVFVDYAFEALHDDASLLMGVAMKSPFIV